MTNEQLIPDYTKWGQANGSKLCVEITSSSVTNEALDVAQNIFDLSDLKLNTSLSVLSYRGPHLSAVPLVLLRFVKTASTSKTLEGEHLTALIDVSSKQLHGFTKMFYEPIITDRLISHTEALNQAISFIQNTAPEMFSDNTIKIPKFFECELSSKLSFSEKIVLGSLELHWINKHYETVIIDKILQQIWGMKVKMFIPAKKLWTWVIVDAAGNIQTFEKEIFWNFDEFMRDTEMWLHDEWLKINVGDKNNDLIKILK